MAAVENVSAEKTMPSESSYEVITLSSDEEESSKSNEEVSFLFKCFILACRPHVKKEAVKDARQLFTKIEGKLTRSCDLVDMLKRYSKEIRKENADMYLELICKAIIKEVSEDNSELNSVNVDEICNDADGTNLDDVISPRDFKQEVKSSSNENVGKPEVSTISDDGDDFVSIRPSKKPTENGNMPSTSGAYTQIDKTTGLVSAKTLSKNHTRKLVRQLKQRLKQISNEIKMFNQTELTLEEMNMADSAYIQENRLKKRFEKTWNKLCKILGRPPSTGRVVEKPVRASSTGYSMIDKAIAKFLKNKSGLFPDFFDIRDVVLRTNQKHDLRMSPQVLNAVIVDIFTDIGNKLQKRREKDLLFNFGSHLLDNFKVEDDPALSSNELARQLEKNRRISKRNLKDVYAKYAHLERYGIDERVRRSCPSRVHKDISDESGTSDDEHDCESSNNRYARLGRHEVEGKSKKSKTSPSSSHIVHEDISSELSTSEDEQDLSKAETEDSITIDDSDVPTSQEYSKLVKCGTDTSLSTSNVEPLLSDADRATSPTFPLTCQTTKENDIGTPVAKVTTATSTFDQGLSDDLKEQQQTLSSSSDCEIINSLKKPVILKQCDISANKTVCETQLNTDDDCFVIDDDEEAITSPTGNPDELSKTSTAKPYDYTTLKAFQSLTQLCDSFDKSKLPALSSDEASESVNSNPVAQIAQSEVCLSQDRTVLNNMEDLTSQKNSSSDSKPQHVSFVLDPDVILIDNEKCSTSKILKDGLSKSPEVSPPSHKTETDQASPSTSTTSNSSQSPKPSTTDLHNSRKRKATTDLAVEVTKSSVKCLEKIAIALKNKKLKLPDSWVTSNKDENKNSAISIAQSTLSSAEESPTVNPISNENKLLSSSSINSKAKINLLQRQVFREKTLNALKVPTKPVCNNSSVNGSYQSVDITSLNQTVSSVSLPHVDSEKCEVIVIDD